MPSLDEHDCRARAAAARVGHLATVRPDGTPWATPVCFALDADSVVTAIDAKPKSTSALARLANIRAHPAVELVVDHYEEDWDRLWWVRLTGHGRVLGGDHDWATDLLIEKYAQYRQDRPEGPMVVMHVARWSGWAAAETEAQD